LLKASDSVIGSPTSDASSRIFFWAGFQMERLSLFNAKRQQHRHVEAIAIRNGFAVEDIAQPRPGGGAARGSLGPFAAFRLEEAGGRRIVALGLRAEAELPPPCVVHGRVGVEGAVTEKMTNSGILGRTMRLRLKHYGPDLMSNHERNDVAVNHETDVPNGNATERLMTVSELASQLRYSPGWVRERVRAGEIPCIRFNSRAWRFHWPTVLAALKNL
jgi:hypothetical protein